ncbi:MAG: hypothetical protein HY883_05000 [Deltaproteobacteria bacterium]|nr:hypothetical protein [Deltaproteobacteria bacterium]
MKVHHIFEDPKKTGILKKAAYALMAVLIIVDILMPRHHREFFWDEIPGFSAVYGLVSALAIIVVAKFLGHQLGIMKKEDYYD